MMNTEFKWHECKPGNMPEDIFPEKIYEIDNGNRVIGAFVGYNKSDWGDSYCICSRYKKRNSDRWTWAGSHPLAWSVIPECKIVKEKIVKNEYI